MSWCERTVEGIPTFLPMDYSLGMCPTSRLSRRSTESRSLTLFESLKF